MSTEINKLKVIWEEGQKKAHQNTQLPLLDFEALVSSIISVGPFYYYIIDFFDMSLTNVSPSIYDIHGFDPETVTFDDILGSIHPDDMDFVSKAEAANIDLVYNKLGGNDVLNYKSNYSFRSKMKNGAYELLNHQAIVLTVDGQGRFGKSLNIHTNINHIATRHNNTFSLLSLKNETSYINIEITAENDQFTLFTKREVEIIRGISEGNSNKEIAIRLNISAGTVKKHRNNIYSKSGCKNSIELVNKSMLQGLI
ncbi:helix-turn-helix transcriptional regulator [Nonlabens sp. Ci31]|uniref:LuxR C-terminal-related transcriptional regulator n=1 Tax=Nonlabens sp. Ci31 TaxID=2608253 RepID=UPI001463ACC3|nr:LuxR C-terminal-related transcriptional regulator [Nonlabens sp. Ci31]QJP33335.1 helix-turn-helix transcriptional regulator [Nonlabens sp. Ci31]